MNNFKFTPAPWTVKESDHIGSVNVSFGDFNGEIECWYHHNSKEESLANATLIASAPQLLKALIDLTKRTEVLPGLKNEHDYAIEIIKKATTL